MNLTLQQTFEKLRDTSQAAGQVQQLGDLIDGELPLQGFLEQLLPHLCGLYGAQAAVAWMKIQGAVLGIRYRMDALLPTASQQKQHEKLVQIAWNQKRPLLAEPSPTALDSSASLPTAGHSDPEFSGNKSLHNPTNHRLLFAPIIHVSEPVALMEIVLPHQAGGLSNIQKQLYLKSAQLVAERIYGGLQRRMLMPEARLSEALREFNVLSGQLQAFQTQIKQTIESKLKKFHGWSFDSLAENQAFAKSLHQILDSHGLRVQCPECGHPAILRCLRAGNSKNGVFVFDHYLESGRTFHGGPTTIPSLKIVVKPARRSSNSGSPDA